MRVEACGNIEPKTGDTLLDHHRSQRLSEPISIINPKNTNNNYLSDKEPRYSGLSLLEGEQTITGRNTYNLTLGSEHPNSALPIGLFLSEEEWSFLKQPHIGLEPYERNKMTSLPKSFTPLASAFEGLGLEGRSSSVTQSASDSTISRQHGSRNGTPSLVKLNDEKEQNNNEVPHESGHSKFSKLNVSASATKLEDVSVNEDGRCKYVPDSFSNDEVDSSPYCTTVTTSSSSLNAQATEYTMPEGHLHSKQLDYNIHQPLEMGMVGDVRHFQHPPFFQSYYTSSSVDTIDSHPMPISSSCRNQVHTPSHLQSHHHCYINSLNAQQTSICNEPLYLSNYNQQQSEQHQNLNHVWQDRLGSYRTDDNSNVDQQNTHDNKWLYEKYNSAAETSGLAQNVIPASQKPTAARVPGGRPDEMDTLVTFLSKFDDKVAAIWGQQGAAAAMLAASFSKAGSNPNSEASTADSNSSTPTGCASDLSYAWGSPTMSSKGAVNGFPTHCMGMPMIQTEQQQRALAESQRVAESFYQKQYMSLQRKDYPQGINLNPPQHKPHPRKSNVQHNNRISIGSPIISPPSGKHTIMHSLKQYFGSPPGQADYHIFRELDASSSIEETERSLKLLHHSEETSGFVRFIPTAVLSDDLGLDQDLAEFDNGVGYDDFEDQPTEVEIKAMQDVLNSLELDCDEELEIVEACKVSQSNDPDELVQSWKTHFIPVATVEENALKHASSQSPFGTLAPHQINPNLPEYKLFGDETPDGYKVFQFPGKTLFPIKYKLRAENNKSVQTETLGELTQSNVQQHDSYYQPYTVFNWEGFNPGNQHPYVLSNRPMSPLSTLGRYDMENNLDCPGSGWSNAVGTGLGSGSLLEVDYNYNRGNDGQGVNYRGSGGQPQYLHAEYCCDSGIGIDVGSRIGFYDDGNPVEYDVDSVEYSGGVGVGCAPAGDDTGGITLLQNPHMGLSGSENDVDYGQFQGGYSVYSAEMSSSVPGSKQGKGSRRRAKVKPCKYFFLDGSCRRGKECKFSHDLTTCRYWAEGSCLKGESCPYLHCFLDMRDMSEDQESNASSNRYLLESENDFPALGCLESAKSNVMGSSFVPMSMGFLPSPALPDENGEGGHYGGIGNFAMLADPAGCAPSISNIGLNNYPFDDLGLEQYGTSGFEGGIFNDGISSLVNKLTFGSNKLNNNEALENKGQGRNKGSLVSGSGIVKQRKNKRLVDEAAASGGSMVGPWGRQVFHDKGVSSGGISSNGWNCSFVVNTKEKRKKKKH